MNPRLAKEFRALRLPWAAGMAAALAGMVASRATGDPNACVYGLNVSEACVALLAAMSFGVEFRHRTLSLLLSQPCPRREVWREKLGVLGVLAGTVGLAQATAWVMAGPYGPHLQMLPVPFLFLALVCAAPLWTLVARSIIGGAVFSFAGVLVLLVLAFWSPAFLLLSDGDSVPGWIYALAMPITALVYSTVCLYAGWRRFERFELKDAILGESTILSGTVAPRERRWHWLRIRPRGALLNLVRKELRLQRPTLVVAVAFCVCWLLAVALKPSKPTGIYELLCPGLACGYIVLAVALAGSISQGEERALGLAAWRLTLPISAWRQWWVKLAVAAVVAVALGVVLPGLLAVATLPDARAGLGEVSLSDSLVKGLPVSAGLWLFFVLSFWAATLLGDTLRAVFTAVLGCIALWLCAVLSVWLVQKGGGLERELLADASALWQRPIYYPQDAEPWAFALAALVISLAALVQSRRQFRRAQVPRAAIIKCAALLLAIAAVAAGWWADFRVSVRGDSSLLLGIELGKAVKALPYTTSQVPLGRGIAPPRFGEKALPYKKAAVPDSPGGISLTESNLEKVFPLSARGELWLRGAKVTLQSVPGVTKDGVSPTNRFLRVFVEFPTGCQYLSQENAGFGYVVPGRVRK